MVSPFHIPGNERDWDVKGRNPGNEVDNNVGSDNFLRARVVTNAKIATIVDKTC